MHYKVLDDGEFYFRVVKRNKEIMGVLKDKTVFVSINEFLHQEVREVEFLVANTPN